MTAELPDVSFSETAPGNSPLEWVGMQGIDLPIEIAEAGYRREHHARVDVQVDMPKPEVKGIHMSRLYRLLDTISQNGALTPGALKQLLEKMIESQKDCGSRNARLRISTDLLVRRSALLTEGLPGRKSYPIKIDTALMDGVFSCLIKVNISYSSTCPCSAALSRQVVEQAFLKAFDRQANVAPDDVATWLRDNASLATPHSQRSEAHVSAEIEGDAIDLGLLALIERVEAAINTPVQTAVKRVDEQAFAALNGQNLMFVEDAARRIEAVIGDYRHASVYVRHLESLHPHNAVAWA
ncbi:MAG: GTP cyclohydrolase FolE2 [Nisaea sp.]